VGHRFGGNVVMHRLLIPPMSTRLFEGKYSVVEWLNSYFPYRESVKNQDDEIVNINKFLGKIGKNNNELSSKFRGCFLGLAIGDAMGTTLEFSSRNKDDSHNTIIGGGPFNLKAGEWTDDTSMALCLAHSLYEKNGFFPEHQMDLYLSWWKDGFLSSNGLCFDIGNTVLRALKKYELTGNPFSGSSDEYSAGNGSLMRLAPVVLFFASDTDTAIKMAAESSKTTHGNIKAIDACRYFSSLILGALKGEDKETILSKSYCSIDKYWEYYPLCPEIEDISIGNYKTKERDEIKSTGYVVDSLEAALWAFYNTDTFESGLIKAVNLGGDSDTIGAIYGQLAGAFYGEVNINIDLIRALRFPHYFYFFSDQFINYYNGNDELLDILNG
jgi:ADP-ribosyl-[dinitrogen reductase] hydrolase